MGEYIEVEPGVRLYVEDLNPSGSKTIVFIHGWPLNHRQFEYQFDELPARGFRVIGIDWRGFGNSDKPYHGYDFDRLADDIRAVFDRKQLRNVVLAGHSAGGAISIRYMSRHGGHGVSKLVLIAAAAPTAFTPETAERFLAVNAGDRPNLMRHVADSFFFRYATEPFREWFIGLGLQAAGWSTAAMIRLLRDTNLYADLAAIRVPTLITHGVHDRVVPFTQALEQHARIPQSRLVPFHYSGHGLFWEEREEFNRLIAEFAG
ncbi:MAG: esterase [Thermobacillus sp. ZCTH02-B1]|uniref:alpha/beta fold hydrolase n=1 Tax=Thermobacillus sp. ZCTH02-B1 TaxID=1858795 RepID=UPI000B57D9D1|nr:alpha/beta hydrolase [Thermobacillus sp. ZCTH02-B1]OUM94044.1 MAG: esterase [Thermobacillus sp. ZCTH02-B1]